MLRTRLRSRPNTVVTSVPFHVDEEVGKVVAGSGKDDDAEIESEAGPV